MIAVDTSAIIAILRGEPEGEAFSEILVRQSAVIGAPTKFEVLLVMARLYGSEGVQRATLFIGDLSLEILPWTNALADLAADALLRFGKGRHPAKLNFGDCMAYALAKSLDAPLLFKGDDFPRTDVARVAR